MRIRNRVLAWVGFMLALALGGCNDFQRTFNGITWECGLSQDQDPSATTYVKILSPDSKDLNARELATTRARFLEKDGRVVPLNLTEKACAALPPRAGTLQIYNLNPGLQLSVSYPERSQSPGLQRLILQKHPELQAQLICPTEGYFVHEALPFPARLIVSGSLQATQIRIVAVPVEAGAEVELFRKNYSQDVDSWPEMLDTLRLPEGSYNLRMDIVQSTRGWDLPLRAEAASELCPLYVLHQEPKIRGLQRLVEPMPAIVKQGDVLPWSSENEYGRLLVCREDKAQDADELGTEDAATCQPQARCQDPANFKLISRLTATDPGVFDYFLYAQDRSGRRSDLACQRIIVSSQKPKLDIRWEEASWNQPVAVMSKPRGGFAASISISHQQRADRRLETNLQCKVDFMVDTGTSMSGRDVICTSGRCRGQRMDRYVSCQTLVEASLHEFWANQAARPLLMRLHVRADDGSGQQAETMRSIWIHPQRWQPETMPLFPSVAKSDEISSFAKHRDGKLFATYGLQSGLWDATRQIWNRSPHPLSQPFTDLKLFNSKEGEVFLTGLIPTRERPTTGDAAIARWNGQTWELLPSHPGTSECFFTAKPHPQSGFWCKAEDGKAIHYAEGHWEDIDFPKDASGKPCHAWTAMEPNATIVAENDGSYWMLCYVPGTLYHRNAQGLWDHQTYELPGLSAIAQDATGRIWTLQRQDRGSKKHDVVGYLEREQWTQVGTPDPKNLASPTFLATPNGSILYYDMLWNDEKQVWERLPGLDRIWPETHLRAFYTQDKQLLLESASGVSLWQAGEVIHYPVTWFDLDNSVVANFAHFGPDGDFWFRAPLQRSNQYKLRRIRLRPWNSFGVETGLFQRSEQSIVGGLWFEPSGFPSVFVARKGLFQASDEGWKTRLAIEQGFWIAGRDKADRFYLTDAKEVYCFQGETLERVLEASDLAYAFNFLVNQSVRQRVWVYQSGTHAVWRLGGGRPESFFLPDALTVNELRELMGQMVAWTTGGLYRFDELQQTWLPTRYEDLGLPADTLRALTVSDRQALVQRSDKTWLLRDLAPAIDRIIKVPFAESILQPQQLIVIKEGDYLLFVQNRGMFRGDGQHWAPLLTDQDVMQMMPGIGIPYFTQSYLDPLGRVWLTGKPFRLMMYDLQSSSAASP